MAELADDMRMWELSSDCRDSSLRIFVCQQPIELVLSVACKSNLVCTGHMLAVHGVGMHAQLVLKKYITHRARFRT